ncbi:DNA-3-methyladenine glycosylase I [Marinicella gelatinilytica]|uniref:DNA-3-methyladenine glycosylase I n=1 Tax=Marinicella gelatinilytica TaxID=2996017 RepID=UPI002260BF94|nr:DNA-3-methyladenine glycosylase I [Marinicella gelatinilytica]MCX7545394.1 DNA-3-methyladenine glycosylase I [Marinicella gelatinilytica]
MKTRCQWAENASQLEQDYHDHEWGHPVYDDKKWFEFVLLEGAQAGLSWSTILHKREGYRQAFADFDFNQVAEFSESDQARLKDNPAIVRNRLKIASAVTNAQAFIQVRKEFGCFNDYIWRFVNGKPIINQWSMASQVPVTTRESDALSQDLKKRGFKFVGSTICYALMQATGLVNDHTTDCFCYKEVVNPPGDK